MRCGNVECVKRCYGYTQRMDEDTLFKKMLRSEIGSTKGKGRRLIVYGKYFCLSESPCEHAVIKTQVEKNYTTVSFVARTLCSTIIPLYTYSYTVLCYDFVV